MAKARELKKVEVMDGCAAAAEALRQADLDVFAAYPITPSTPIVHGYGAFHANGYVDAEVVLVESEHAAMSACVGAAAAGGRVATATASQGLALMIEVLYQASGMRIPLVLEMANRALAAPLNVNGDHSDVYLARDCGWISLDAYSPQEAYDMTLMAFRIGEKDNVRLPVIVNQDGFITSHTAQSMEPLQDDEAKKFVGEYKAHNALLDFNKISTHGVQAEEDWHFEFKAQHHNALIHSLPEIKKVFKEFEKVSGRKYNVAEEFMMDDAEVAIVAMGTTYETAQYVAKQARKEGIKAGVVGIRVFRPFPVEDLAKVLGKVKAISVLDRCQPGGALGALHNEISAVCMGLDDRPVVNGYVYGLGGRDTTEAEILEVYRDAAKNAKTGKLEVPYQQFLGLRGPKLSFY